MGVSEQAGEGGQSGEGQGNDRDKSHSHSLALAADPIDVTAVNSHGATSTGKNGGAEIASGPGRWYTLRLSLGLGAQKLCKWLQCSTSHITRQRKQQMWEPASIPSFGGLPGIKTITKQIMQGQKQLSNLSSLYSLCLNPLERTQP